MVGGTPVRNTWVVRLILIDSVVHLDDSNFSTVVATSQQVLVILTPDLRTDMSVKYAAFVLTRSYVSMSVITGHMHGRRCRLHFGFRDWP